MSKKVIAAGLLTLLVALLAKPEKRDRPPLRVVQSVDLTRYAGLWYEVARLPNRFEEKGAGDVTAEYTLVKADRIKVVNRCRKKDGRMTTAEGVARLADKRRENSRLEVRFAPGFLSFLPLVWGDYQIMELAPDYSYTLSRRRLEPNLWARVVGLAVLLLFTLAALAYLYSEARRRRGGREAHQSVAAPVHGPRLRAG